MCDLYVFGSGGLLPDEEHDETAHEEAQSHASHVERQQKRICSPAISTQIRLISWTGLHRKNVILMCAIIRL